jgi:hypothetical protein
VTRTILLFFGLLGPLLQFGTDRLAGILLSNYSFLAQSMSELGAAGSPVRSLVVSLTCVATALMTAFGVGVWRVGGQALLPRVVAALLIGNAVLGLVAMFFFPPQFGERPAFGSVGVILMFLSVVCFVLAMIVGAAAFSGWLRVLSIGIPTSYVILAIVRFTAATSFPSAEAVSMIGAQERTMGFSFLFWVMSLAVYLLLSGRGVESANGIGG